MKVEKKAESTSKITTTKPEVKTEFLLKRIHSFEGRLAESITHFSGSMNFVYMHILAFTLFFIFQPFPVEFLNIFLSLEAVFLATFIMIAQNRQALLEQYRELEEEKEEQEAEEEVEDIQKDLDDIKNAISFIQLKISNVEKVHPTSTSGNGNTKK